MASIPKPPPAEPENSCYIADIGLTKLSMPWFVVSDAVEGGEKAFVPRGQCEVECLVNGSAAFGALEKAILGATQSIDYITWGFDPSMRFTSGGRTIGDILLEKAQTVTVRLLVWYAGYAWSTVYGKADAGLTETGTDYATANLPGYDENPGEKSKYITSAEWYKKIRKHPRIHFVSRPMDTGDVGDAVAQDPHLDPPDFKHEQAMKKFATHHQKMVIVDYNLPGKAQGFVMGSNTLPRYWDTDDHPLHHPNRSIDYFATNYEQLRTVSPGAFSKGRAEQPRIRTSVYFQPWQDISAKVSGEVIFDLNVNFARAWARAGGPALEAGRSAIKPQSFALSTGYPTQVVRTQPQEKDHSISHTYFQDVRNARSYIYFENQYFRLPELTREIAQAAEALSKGGRKQSLYVFVVTNVPDDHGKLNTYQMLSALGRSEQMPKMQDDPTVRDKGMLPLECTKGDDEAGLQTVVCTLTACEDQHYLPIYTHSKLMIIDDHYYVLGSANLNKRSMATDSEINVSVPDPEGAKGLRVKLWTNHRGGAPREETVDEFTKWKTIASKNLRFYKKKSEPLTGRLTWFMDESPAVRVASD